MCFYLLLAFSAYGVGEEGVFASATGDLPLFASDRSSSPSLEAFAGEVNPALPLPSAFGLAVEEVLAALARISATGRMMRMSFTKVSYSTLDRRMLM